MPGTLAHPTEHRREHVAKPPSPKLRRGTPRSWTPPGALRMSGDWALVTQVATLPPSTRQDPRRVSCIGRSPVGPLTPELAGNRAQPAGQLARARTARWLDDHHRSCNVWPYIHKPRRCDSVAPHAGCSSPALASPNIVLFSEEGPWEEKKLLLWPNDIIWPISEFWFGRRRPPLCSVVCVEEPDFSGGRIVFEGVL